MKLNRRITTSMTWFTFLIPALILYGAFFIYPSAGSLYYSFTDWAGLSKNIDFVGFRNYIRIFEDEALLSAIKNTVILVVIVTVLQNVLALALAEALNGNIKSRNLLRTVFFLPAVMSTLAVGFIWSYLYNPVDGVINALLRSIGLSSLAQDWLGNPDTALYAIIVILIWQNAGYSMVIYLSGLQSISETYYEAASIDGANYAQKFKHITFPLIGPAITINVVLCVIGGMKTFDVIYATTGGGPGYATETFASILFRKAFSGMAEFGYGSAVAVVLFVVILLVSNLLTKFLRGREVES
ncbi:MULTISPECIES: carbohydrate ABC transporter permease [Cohnella]|uniref:Multiple sugar transport system permease protein/raffinose/stachyose/melibiose transport system permease protein n=1 Tax=Cohnella phaseoli TaxID=456490 RepID=A0A3D9IG85_9BACL|nr:sugar ABC transporter permease [Cohnella phaseoli]RED60579.1 multiple sugar transport system permease protein/raffinose/stachyose/melibiose transport system permease protein [Cohnella phaseoli]